METKKIKETTKGEVSNPGSMVEITNVMIDLETIGTSYDSIILTIGAIQFDKAGKASSNTFYERIDIDSYKPYKSTFGFDQNTLIWWMNQNKDARDEAFSMHNRKNIKEVLVAFSKWINKMNETYITKIWSHGSIFDIVLLEYHLSNLGIEKPWKYWNVRDTRTLYDFGGIRTTDVKIANPYPAHHALGDCIKQIQAYKMAMETLGKG